MISADLIFRFLYLVFKILYFHSILLSDYFNTDLNQLSKSMTFPMKTLLPFKEVLTMKLVLVLLMIQEVLSLSFYRHRSDCDQTCYFSHRQ